MVGQALLAHYPLPTAYYLFQGQLVQFFYAAVFLQTGTVGLGKPILPPIFSKL